MYAKDLLEIIERYAPLKISEEMCALTGGRDNSGIIIDSGSKITKALFSLDFSFEAAMRAEREGFDCIVTHHPAIYNPIMRVAGKNQTESAVAAALKAGASVISAHLNLDAAKQGIDYHLAKIFGDYRGECLYRVESGGEYGHIVYTEGQNIEELGKIYSLATGSEKVLCYGKGETKKAAVFCGAGLNMEELYMAKEKGIDTVISSDVKHHVISEAAYLKMNLMCVTHYSAENYGFNKFYQFIKIKLQGKTEAEYHLSKELL